MTPQQHQIERMRAITTFAYMAARDGYSEEAAQRIVEDSMELWDKFYKAPKQNNPSNGSTQNDT